MNLSSSPKGTPHHRSWWVPFGEFEKLFFKIQYKKKLIISGALVFLLERSSLGTSDIQGCYSPKAITYIYIYMIYALIHEGDPIPCRTTYIEYRSPVKNINPFFEEHHLIPLVFITKLFFFIVLRHRSWGVPFSELEKRIF